jgi:hypothetical protein
MPTLEITASDHPSIAKAKATIARVNALQAQWEREKAVAEDIVGDDNTAKQDGVTGDRYFPDDPVGAEAVARRIRAAESTAKAKATIARMGLPGLIGLVGLRPQCSHSAPSPELRDQRSLAMRRRVAANVLENQGISDRLIQMSIDPDQCAPR